MSDIVESPAELPARTSRLLCRLSFAIGLFIFAFIALLNVTIVWVHANVNEASLTRTFQTPVVIPLIAIYLLAFYYVYRYCNKKAITIKKLTQYCLALYFIVATLIFIMFSYSPAFDASIVMNIGNHPRLLGQSEYLLNYPNNIGYFVECLITNLIGANQLAAMHFLINIPAVLLTVYSVIRISEQIFKNNSITKWTIILCAFCMPLYFLCVFYYNDPPGIALATFAVFITLKVIEKLQLKLVILLLFLSILAVFIRENTLIVLIAICIALLLSSDNLRHLVKMMVITILILLMPMLFVGIAEQAVISIASSHEVAKTAKHDVHDLKTPPLSFIAMSMITFDDTKRELPQIYDLRPNVNSTTHRILADGWWNLYGEICVGTLGSRECTEKSKQVISDKVQYYANNPDVAARYYFNKVSSQWAEPTFQSTRYFMTKTIDPNKNPTLQNIRMKIPQKLDLPMNAYHIIVMLFAFLGLLNCRRGLTVAKMLPCIAIVGYFLFLILWEAKSRYVFMVFPLFLPYAASGALLIYNRFQAFISNLTTSRKR